MLGLDVPRGALFYGTTRRRKPVEFTAGLRARVEEAARRCHELFEARVTPRVARNKRCEKCSLLELCLPDVTGNPSRAAIHLANLSHLTDPREEAPW